MKAAYLKPKHLTLRTRALLSHPNAVVNNSERTNPGRHVRTTPNAKRGVDQLGSR